MLFSRDALFSRTLFSRAAFFHELRYFHELRCCQEVCCFQDCVRYFRRAGLLVREACSFVRARLVREACSSVAHRGKAPAIFLAQPEGLGSKTVMQERAEGPTVTPRNVLRLVLERNSFGRPNLTTPTTGIVNLTIKTSPRLLIRC